MSVRAATAIWHWELAQLVHCTLICWASVAAPRGARLQAVAAHFGSELAQNFAKMTRRGDSGPRVERTGYGGLEGGDYRCDITYYGN